MGTPVATPQRSTAGDAQKKAEEIFQTKTIAEIREFEARTRQEIEGKKKQLRQLVGDSYRDLIESADKIVAISNSCENILSNVIAIQGGFSELTINVSSSFKAPLDKARSLKNHEVLYAMGSRVKYLLETPEMIWGCLDSQQYVQAARRYIQAQSVYRLLRQNFSPELLAKFPLLGHQWPQVQKFRDQILEGVHSRLSSSIQLSSRQVSDAVVAAMMLTDSGSSLLALKLFLDSRRQWLQRQLSVSAESTSVDDVAGVLSRAASGFMDTISQVGDVFLWANQGSDATCLLAESAREDEVQMTELIFKGAHGIGSDDSQSAEMKAWRSYSQELLERLSPVPNLQAEQCCADFAVGVSKDLTSACQQLLSSCTDASGLCRVEGVIRTTLAEWKPPTKPAKATLQAEMAAGAPWRGKADSETWEMVCEFVLGRPIPIWQDLFHPPFTSHAKLLIQRKFAQIRTSIEGPLDDCLAQVSAGDAPPVGAVRIGSWPQAPLHSTSAGWASGDMATAHTSAPRSPTKRFPGSSFAASPDWAAMALTGARASIHALLQQLEAQLQQVLSDCLLLLGDTSTSAYASHLRTSALHPAVGRSSSSLDSNSHPSNINSYSANPYSSNSNITGYGTNSNLYGANSGLYAGAPNALSMVRTLSGYPGTPMATPVSLGASRKDMAARAQELEPFIQQKSAEMAGSLAELLQSRVDALPQPEPSEQGAVVVEQLLVLAQLCSVLGGDSTFVQMTSGGLDGLKGSSAAGARSVGSYTRGSRIGHLGGSSGKHHQLAEAFRNVGAKCYRAWANWAAAGLSQQLLRALQANDLLSTNTTPAAWEETTVSPTVDPDAGLDGGEDMRFWLPACPSPEVLTMLMGACSEVSRAGDYAIDPEALQVLQWELLGAVLQACGKLLLPPPSNKRKLSEKGVLQVLLDVRFLRDVLTPARPPLVARQAYAAAHSAATGGGNADPPIPDMATTLLDRKREVQALESSLQDLLDPIDWATYEPYLAANATRYLARCSAVLGMLTHAQRGTSSASLAADGAGARPAGAAGAQDSNPLNVMSVAGRFQYLPISTPSSGAGAGMAGKGRIGAPGAAGLAGLQWISGAQDNPSETFSFSTLSTGGGAYTSGGLLPDGLRLDPMAAGTASTLGALQAKLQAGTLGTFSSLLGDKAAEMTAMAQQRLETMGLHDLGQGLFSSLAKGVAQSGYARSR